MIKNDSENAYYYVFDPGSSYVAYDINRFYGFSLRCLSSLPRPSGRGRRVMLQILMLSVFIGVWESKEL